MKVCREREREEGEGNEGRRVGKAKMRGRGENFKQEEFKGQEGRKNKGRN